MAALEFRLAELQSEVEALSRFASRFLDPEGPKKLDQFKYQLAPLLRDGGGPWTIPKEDPLRSKPTNQYSEGRGDAVWAAISCKWELKRIGRMRLLRVDGIASTSVELFRKDADVEESLGLWRMEIGDDESPGCHFHAQIMGQQGNPPFPNWLAIPRLPGLFLTPASTIEFVLSELYQKEWAKATSQLRTDLSLWAAVQKPRILSWLSWQRRTIEGAALGTLPWTSLKGAKPDDDLVNSVRGGPRPAEKKRKKASRT